MNDVLADANANVLLMPLKEGYLHLHRHVRRSSFIRHLIGTFACTRYFYTLLNRFALGFQTQGIAIEFHFSSPRS
jgi:hypothetical protein